MARHKGHHGSITAGGDIVGEIESFDIELSVEELDANVMGVDWTDVEGGQGSATGSINVLRDPADVGQTELVQGAKVALVLFTEGTAIGLTKITGNFLVTSRAVSTSVGDLVKTAYNIRNAGTVVVAPVVA
jgi:hypothetical protein